MGELGIEDDPRGRNIAIAWDEGNAPIGERQLGRATLVSPVLTYLDLASEPERAAEARKEMRRYLERLLK